MLQSVTSTQLDVLDRQTFAGRGCVEHGIVVLKGAASWGAHERGYIEVPVDAGCAFRLPLAYDERKAPYACTDDGREDCQLLVSLADQQDVLACTWARVSSDSPVAGVGIDLVAQSRLAQRPSGRDPARLLLTEGERAIAAHHTPDHRLTILAALFGAKEAAFKSTAAPLRRWYDTHSDELRYEVRHFVMEEPGFERGTGRDGAAQQAIDRMGIARIAVQHCALDGMVIVTAVALTR